MEPLTNAGAFATIISLVCNYRQEKGASEALDHQKFIEWLEYHRHEEIKNLICNTAALRAEIDNLLRADHAVIMQKLEAINTTLATLISHVGEFRGLTLTMMPGAEISDQAVSILRQLVNSNSSYFICVLFLGSGGFSMQLEEGNHVEITEPRFLDDDLSKLCGLGLVSLEYGGDGTTQIYKITRSSARLIEAIDGKMPARTK